jgi:hypothetical protein
MPPPKPTANTNALAHVQAFLPLIGTSPLENGWAGGVGAIAGLAPPSDLIYHKNGPAGSRENPE